MPDELEIIASVRNRVRWDDRVVVGLGDDAAVITGTGGVDQVVCCDLLVEGVHFRREWAPPRLIGHKALAVTLSDVAAMGGFAKFAMISIAIPGNIPSGFVDEVFDGLFELADASDVTIVGGDTSSSPDSLFMDVSVIGECTAGKAITRRGARVGDSIFVSGALGASAYGLTLLEKGFRLNAADGLGSLERSVRDAILKHLSPQPRLSLGHAIGVAGVATAMIDVSDGLSTDLSHILDESGVGATIQAEAIPVAECIGAREDRGFQVDPLAFALNGGEEYELVFTCAAEHNAAVQSLSASCGIRITRIGEIVAERGLRMNRNGRSELIQASGYEHRF